MTTTKTAPKKAKRNKEEQKKLMIRIVCWVIVAALVLTSGIAMLWSYTDQGGTTLDFQAMLDAGLLVDNGDGTYTILDPSILGGEEGHVHDDGTVHLD